MGSHATLAFQQAVSMPRTVAVNARKQPKQARSRAMVAAIVEATTRILREHGYAGASTNRVAKLAGVSPGSLYQYFPNKDALVLAVADQHTEEVMELLRGAALGSIGATLPEAVRAFVRAFIAAHCCDARLHRALIAQMMHLGIDRFLEVQREATAFVRQWMELHSDVVRVRDRDMAAWMLVTAAESVVHAGLIEDPDKLHSLAFEQELVDLLVAYLTAARPDPAPGC